MTTKQISSPIEYWNDGKTRIISPEDENGRKIEIGYFFGVQFTGYSTHYPLPLLYSHHNEKLILPTKEMFMSLGRATLYDELMHYEGDLKNTDLMYNGDVYYFVYNMANYYHFIYDTLPYLYGYFNEKQYFPNLKLLVSPPEGKLDLYPFVWDTLALLGITREDVVFLNDRARYKMVLVGSSLTHDGLSNTPPHKKVFDIINRLQGEYDGPEKIYVSRRTWTQNNSANIGTNMTEARKCVNEDEVADYFISLGFEEVFCENLSMKEKIGLFRGAKVVAGPIGGGMVNTIFSPPETKVISINSPTFFDINTRFEYSMCHTDLHHFNDTEFAGDSTGWVEPGDVGVLSISGGLNSPWKVNMDSLKKFVESIDDI